MRFKVVYGSPVKYFIDGKEVSRDEYDLASTSKLEEVLGGGVKTAESQLSTCWPMKSEGMAVHPEQIEEVRARNAKHGLFIEYDPIGRPILDSRGQRRDLMRLERVHDKHGGYSD